MECKKEEKKEVKKEVKKPVKKHEYRVLRNLNKDHKLYKHGDKVVIEDEHAVRNLKKQGVIE